MCFSQYAQYAPRPVEENSVETHVHRPSGAPPSKAELDENLFGPIPTPPEWRVSPPAEASQEQTTTNPNDPAAAVFTTGGNSVAPVKTQTVEAVVVELANGTKLLICPL